MKRATEITSAKDGSEQTKGRKPMGNLMTEEDRQEGYDKDKMGNDKQRERKVRHPWGLQMGEGDSKGGQVVQAGISTASARHHCCPNILRISLST